MNVRTAILLSLNLCLVLSPVPLRAWTLDADRRWVSVSLDQVSSLSTVTPGPDLFSSAFGDLETNPVTLSDGTVKITAQGRLLWSSPADWKVTQVETADMNRDGAAEVVMLVWRPFKPWPVDSTMPYHGRIDTFQNASGQSCHLILIGWKDGRFKEVWAGSALSNPLTGFAAADLNGDGVIDLATLDGAYADPPGAPARTLSAWEWNGFGFTLLDRVQGRFTALTQPSGRLRSAQPGTILMTTP